MIRREVEDMTDQELEWHITNLEGLAYMARFSQVCRPEDYGDRLSEAFAEQIERRKARAAREAS